MSRIVIAFLCVTSVATLASAAEPKPLDRKTAEENLKKAKEVAEKSESGLTWLSNALWVAGKKSDSAAIKDVKSKFDRALAGPVKDLNKGLDEVQKAVGAKDDKEASKLSGGLRDKLKLLKPDEQAEELVKLAKKVRELPIGLVSEKVDDKFVVSADLLVTKPKEAEGRFKDYLAAVQANATRMKAIQEQLDDAAEVAGKAGKLFLSLADRLGKVAPHAGPFKDALTGECLSVGKLANAYNGLSADAKTMAKEAKRAAEVEQRRHDNLKASLKTYFGFSL